MVTIMLGEGSIINSGVQFDELLANVHVNEFFGDKNEGRIKASRGKWGGAPDMAMLSAKRF